MAVDVVIVGAGSAGCVLASRLSEDAARRVLLVEAGPDYSTLSELPDDIADASQPTLSHDWGYLAECDSLGQVASLPRARLVGGCSATNGCFAVRGSPAEFDGWAALGNPGWSFEEVLPYFNRLETDTDFVGEYHGCDGPVPIRRHPPEELNQVQSAFIAAAVDVGHPYVADHNRPRSVGVGPTPRNARDGVRMSTALTYLPVARARPNLTIRSGATVDRVELSNGRATGIRLATGEVINADLIVLAGGAYASPAILARSGIGPAGPLGDLGIGVVVELEGVGANLVDHPIVAVDLPTRPGSVGPRFRVLATMRSEQAMPGVAPDLQLFVAGPFDVPAEVSASGAVFGIVAALMSPRSHGRLRLRSPDPDAPPLIEVGHLRHPDDVSRLVEATLAARRISRADPIAQFITGQELAPGSPISDDDFDGLAMSIKARVATYHHPVGTCRMGPDPDQGAVVDAHGQVYGTDRLLVADASIMPTSPAANTNLPTIMLAERIADWLREN